MQIRLFTIPIGDSGMALQELNSFLRGHKILEVDSQLVSNAHGANWCFCVRYIGIGTSEKNGEKSIPEKVDYRKVLDEPTFQKFSKLREIRKQIATQEAISAFIIFTDEELAALARLDEVTEKGMRSIKGVGDKKIERFGKFFVKKEGKDEAAGESS